MIKYILIGCEFSQMVTKAFREKGHKAFSCDLRATEGDPDWHFQCDVLTVLNGGLFKTQSGREVFIPSWYLGIFHPECTHLTLAGARWFYDQRFPDKPRQRDEAIDFFNKIKNCDIPRIAIENPQPLGYVIERVGKYTQKIQPWQFGDAETKGVCLWLKNLKKLEPSVAEKPEKIQARVWRMAPGPERQKERSRFFPGIAKAMTGWADD